MNAVVVTFLTFLTLVNGQLNCSLYNPCGHHGSCRDNAAGKWTCACIHYYPLLAAIHLHSIFTLTCGTLYAWLDYSLTIVNQGMCKFDYYPIANTYKDTSNGSSLIYMLKYYGTGSSLIAIQLCTDIPRYLCLAYVSVKLPVMLIGKFYRRLKRKRLSKEEQFRIELTQEERVLLRASDSNSAEMLYVRNLFRSADKRPRSDALIARLIPKFIYEWRDDFHFSSRVLCVYSSICLLLFFIAIHVCIETIPYLHAFQGTLQQFVQHISSSNKVHGNTNEVKEQTSLFIVPQLVRPFILAVATTAIIIIIHLLALLANIRRNLFQSFRGDCCEIPRRQRSKYVSYATGLISADDI
ncbi:unnamed protein product [Rotaria sordida]|uniref:Uncharacterized protein n=2 Tax=Rotaria sordida TaxID=392033 RepID=A0A814WDZ3_9BILA|nr:unnamed protein product [Rotaria sordida]